MQGINHRLIYRDKNMSNPSPDDLQFIAWIKENLTAIAIGTIGMLGTALIGLGRFIGLRALDDIKTLKTKQSYYCTRDELVHCQERVSEKIDEGFERVRQTIKDDLKRVHERLDNHIENHNNNHNGKY